MAHLKQNCNCAECTLQRGGEVCKKCGEVGEDCLCLTEQQRVKFIWLRQTAFAPIHMARDGRTFCGLPYGPRAMEIDDWAGFECKACLRSWAYKQYRKEQIACQH